jgi:hypothetical protein
MRMNGGLLTEIQLYQIAKVFDLKRQTPTLPVRDGVVTPTSKLYWRCEDGPELVLADDHWGNIQEFPEAYQLEKPSIKVTYRDE